MLEASAGNAPPKVHDPMLIPLASRPTSVSPCGVNAALTFRPVNGPWPSPLTTTDVAVSVSAAFWITSWLSGSERSNAAFSVDEPNSVSGPVNTPFWMQGDSACLISSSVMPAPPTPDFPDFPDFPNFEARR